MTHQYSALSGPSLSKIASHFMWSQAVSPYVSCAMNSFDTIRAQATLLLQELSWLSENNSAPGAPRNKCQSRE